MRHKFGTLEVTEADIWESSARRMVRLNTYNPETDCPIGIAISRQYARVKFTEHNYTEEKKLTRVRAHPDYLCADFDTIPLIGRSLMWEATPAIRAYMRKWDRQFLALPHRFTLYER